MQGQRWTAGQRTAPRRCSRLQVGTARLEMALPPSLVHRARACIADVLMCASSRPLAEGAGQQCTLLRFPAAEAGHAHVVQALLRRKADPSAADLQGTTPLLAALAGGHRRCAELLLAAGAAARGRVGGRSAVHWAAHHGMAGVLRTLLQSSGAEEVSADDDAG